MTISFIGLGKLGLPLSTCFGKNGLKVFAIDKNEKLIEDLRSGTLSWTESGIQENLSLSAPNMTYTDSYDCISETSVSVVLVNTPSNAKDGSFSNIYVEQTLVEIAKRMRRNHTIILSSTVMPGSILEDFIPLVENISGLSLAKGEFGFAYVPDFVALGNVIRDFENPDFLVIGCDSEKTFQETKNIYSRIVRNDCPILKRSLPETELIKVSLNAFITTKISFANFLGLMARRMSGDINIDNVTSAVGMDKRIGTRYFSSGVSYGGTCFPRDTWAFIKCAQKVGLESFHMFANEKINQLTDEEWLAEIYRASKDRVVLLGASFKPGTAVVTEGLTLKLIPSLLKRNFSIHVLDDNAEALDNIRSQFPQTDNLHLSHIGSGIPDDSVVLLTIPDKSFVNLDYSRSVTLDPWNLLRG